jgi:DNA-binding LytR/AlgR family response regulator
MWLKIIQGKIWFYGFAGMIFTSLQIISLLALTKFPVMILLADSLIFTLWIFLLAVPLYNLIRYGNLQSVLQPVRIIIYLVLGVFTMAIVVGGIAGLEWLFFRKDVDDFLSILPLKAVLAFFVFLLMIQNSKYQLINEEDTVDEKAETENEIKPEKLNSTSNESDSVNQVDKAIQERIAVKSGAKIHVVPIAEIVCLMADGDYVQVVTEKGRYLKEQTMKYFETHLPENQFVRIHRSCLVNISFISRIELYEKQNQQLLLKNGDKVKVSQAGYRLLREKLSL